MRRSIALLGIAALAACSSLPDIGGGVVQLQVFTPDTVGGVGCTSSTSCTLPHGDSLILRARALNLQGDSVAAAIFWVTPDTLLIALDSTRGVVSTKGDTAATARVQAGVGTLRSTIIFITIQRDTTTTTGLRGQQ